MANHVNFNVTFHQINDAAKAKLNEMYGRIRKENNYQWLSDMFVEGDLTYEETEKYTWTTENIGPKWSYLNDFDENGFQGEAAWSAPVAGLVKLLTILEEFDPKMITSITYEDESPNFVGWEVYEGSECYDGEEEDWEEIRERVINDSEALTEESWDDDEEDWVDEEASDTFYEEMWESIGNWQWAAVRECVDAIEDSQTEEE
jgi:hypothetical protein